MKECAVHLGELVHTYRDIQYFGSIGCCVNRLGDLQQSYQQAGQAFACRFFSEMNQVVHYSQMEQMLSSAEEPIDIHSVDGSKVNRKTLENFLKQGISGEARGFVEEYGRKELPVLHVPPVYHHGLLSVRAHLPGGTGDGSVKASGRSS